MDSSSSARWQNPLRLDMRSLALFRILLGSIVVLDLAFRSVDLTAHYTDFGVLSRAILLESNWNRWFYSLHLINGEFAWQVALFVIAGLCGLLLAVGYRTRLMAFLCLVLTISLHNRNPLVLQSGDDFLRMLLLWSCFLPLGHRWSMDARAGRSTGVGNQGLPVLALMLQMIMVYSLGGVIKITDGTDWTSGTAIFYALSLDQFATWMGISLRSWTFLHQPMTHVTLLLELIGPLLLLCPVAQGPIRLALVLSFWGFHAGIAATLEVGLFSLIAATAWVPFLPSQVWRWFGAEKLPGPDSGHSSFKSLVARPLAMVTLAGVTVLMVYFNVTTVKQWKIKLPQSLQPYAYTLRINQRWAMFSKPPRRSGWLVMPGQTKDGQTMDPFHRRVPDFFRPEVPSLTFKRQRWRKYLENIGSSRHEVHRLHFGRYLCRSYNRQRPETEQLDAYHIIMMYRDTDREKSLHPPPQFMTLWQHECFTGGADRHAEYFKKKLPEILKASIQTH